MTREELLKGLTAEQREKIENCKTTEEILRVAQEEGIELTDEQLEAVTGGCGQEKQEEETTEDLLALARLSNKQGKNKGPKIDS